MSGLCFSKFKVRITKQDQLTETLRYMESDELLMNCKTNKNQSDKKSGKYTQMTAFVNETMHISVPT